jgi:hypothetical protein
MNTTKSFNKNFWILSIAQCLSYLVGIIFFLKGGNFISTYWNENVSMP